MKTCRDAIINLAGCFSPAVGPEAQENTLRTLLGVYEAYGDAPIFRTYLAHLLAGEDITKFAHVRRDQRELVAVAAHFVTLLILFRTSQECQRLTEEVALLKAEQGDIKW